MKEFFKSPKKTAILGLISSILMIVNIYVNGFTDLIGRNFAVLGYNLFVLGYIIYFGIVLIRIYKNENINIKIANYILLTSIAITIVAIIANILIYGINIYSSIYFIVEVITFTYLYFLLVKQKLYINNKVYAVVVFLLIVTEVIASVIFNNVIDIKVQNEFETQKFLMDILSWIIRLGQIGYIGIIPYFYNYYNIMKKGNKNGK